ncbi:high frequency lysogenization protein HflD [Litorivivens sp.]|uniref:high frequency lysogenization protein HflD n=1 Tax=Litorivivens sp. TaxID=2020868 RepID=UPI003565BF07
MSQPQTDQALRDQVLALAGICQSVALVDSIARTGNAEPEAFEACLKSLFSFSSQSPIEAYGSVASLELGLRKLHDLLTGTRSVSDRELVRYIIGITHLQKQLEKTPEAAAIIRSRLDHTERGQLLSDKNINELASPIAGIYKDTVSNFKFRLKINGSAQQLQNAHNADRIRALLLAGIRGAYLWKQLGGRRRHFLFAKNRIVRTVREILQREIPH